jgi:hypothetical protein
VIRLPLLGFSVPEHVAHRRPKLEKMGRDHRHRSIDAHKEQEILGDFINDVADQIVRAICERLESATIVALDPIVLFVAPI